MADFNYKKIKRFDSDVYVFEFNPKVLPSQIALGVPNKKEPLTQISHNWFKTNGYQELAKINLGFFDMKAGGAEHLGLLIRDGGTMSGSPESSSSVECYLTKDFKFVVEQLTTSKATQLKTNVNWGASLSYALLVDGKKNFIAKESYDHFFSKAPRTLIGQKADGNMVLVVADGRTTTSKGLTGFESADLMLELGCVNAINADGGGSSEMVIKTKDGLKVANKPSDGAERQIGSALIVFTKDNSYITEEEIKVPTKRKIALDAGHGSDTYKKTGGKGVPTLEEHTFNASVVAYAKTLAEYNGFEVVLTQPLNGLDVPLTTRTNKANAENVEVLISFHADAASSATAKGHTAFYWYNSATSKKLAELWDKYADSIMKNGDRNLKPCVPNTDTDFHMVRETKMPAILIEHAFMTNAEELALLKSEDFRKKCGEVAVKALCEYFGVTYKSPETTAPTQPTAPIVPNVDVQEDLEILVSAGIINSPEYWVKVIGNQTAVNASYIGIAFKNMAKYIIEKNSETPTNPTPTPEPQPEPTPSKELKTWDEVKKLATNTSVLVELGAKHGTGQMLKNGVMITAGHVGAGYPVKVKFKNGQSYTANPIATHPDADLALYQINEFEAIPSLPYLELTTDAIKTGTELVSVGNPKSSTWVVKTGKVCREVANPVWEFDYAIDVDNGNSGGGLINQYGEVVGIIVQKTSVIQTIGSSSSLVAGGEAISVTHPTIQKWIKDTLK